MTDVSQLGGGMKQGDSLSTAALPVHNSGFLQYSIMFLKCVAFLNFPAIASEAFSI
jgi:hypothetical protein